MYEMVVGLTVFSRFMSVVGVCKKKNLKEPVESFERLNASSQVAKLVKYMTYCNNPHHTFTKTSL